MRKEDKKKDSILKSRFFQILFGIPAICVSLLLFWGMFLPDEPGEEPLTWLEFWVALVMMLIFWFIVSLVIAFIINKFKKVKFNANVQYIEKPEEKIVVSPKEIKEESKGTKNKKLSKGCLYTCENKIDVYEYKKLVKYFPEIYWSYVLNVSLVFFLVACGVAFGTQSLWKALVFFGILELFYMVAIKVRLEHLVERTFKAREKKGYNERVINLAFYEDYFLIKGEVETLKIYYRDIERCVETDTNFYLKFGKRNKIIIIQKNACDLELINFIREKFKDLENHLGDRSNFKGVKKYHNPEFINKFMIILFIIAICSLWGALWSTSLVDKINPQHGFNFTKNYWVIWCWLPLPLLSIIFGFKYKNAGFKCTKNIVGGFIIGFLLLVYGSFCLFPTFSQDYSKIDTYRNIIDAQLPDNGELEIQDWGTYFDQDKTNYTIINAYYDKEDVRNLVSSIENSSNWLLSKDIKSELKILVPSQLKADDDAYYSLYNMTTKEYNTLPEISGDYEIYAMKYDKSDKHLEIHKFNYEYKK